MEKVLSGVDRQRSRLSDSQLHGLSTSCAQSVDQLGLGVRLNRPLEHLFALARVRERVQFCVSAHFFRGAAQYVMAPRMEKQN
jgi:hypothetical protein